MNRRSCLALFQGLVASLWLVIILGCKAQHTPQSSPQRLLEVKGAALDRIPLTGNNVAYLQTIDLHQMRIDHLVGDVDNRKGTKGLYYPSQDHHSSPYFKRLTTAVTRDHYQNQYPTQAFTIINASFFEEYQFSTRLSFPLKQDGKVITAGSSPYGPNLKPADPYYRKVQLRALTWDDQKATILTYNPSNGYPLNLANVKNAVVSYAYRDHPAFVLNHDPENLYHVLGVVNPNDTGKGNRLLIATVNRATLEQAANILRQHGAQGDLMTIDGGISTYLWSTHSGDLILPQVAEGEKVPALPHYLGIRSKLVN